MGERFRGDRQPVILISWHDAQVFCQKLTQLARRTYRLPSEAEWEYACRAGTQSQYSFGDDETQLDNYAWYEDNSNQQPHPVGQKEPNAFGLYDMQGNVWEWCTDHWHENYKNAPTDGSPWLDGKNDNQFQILRGGSWINLPRHCSPAYRNNSSPDGTGMTSGFRVVCSSP
jgi:formylglycine-generating enzyme required for sulfatase activity